MPELWQTIYYQSALPLHKFHLMKKLVFLLLLPVAIVSCNLESESYSNYSDYIDIDTTMVPETAHVGDTVNIYSRSIAYNGCWSNLKLFYGKYNDTLYIINSRGVYESNDGICPEILVMCDSTFHFMPDTSGTFIFVSQSRNKPAIFDTLTVSYPASK